MSFIVFIITNLFIIFSSCVFTALMSKKDVPIYSYISRVVIMCMSLIYVIIYISGFFKLLNNTSVSLLSGLIFVFALSLAIYKRNNISDIKNNILKINLLSFYKSFSVSEKIIAFIFITAMLYKLSGVILLSPFDYDGIKYHLPSLVEYVKNGCFLPIKGSLWANAYPKGFETFNLWMLLFFKDGFLIKLPQFLTVLSGGIFCYGALRNLKIPIKLSFFASALAVSTPVLTAQMNSAYVDAPLASMIFAAVFFISEINRKYSFGVNVSESISDTVFFSMSVMLLLGIKYSALAYGAMLFLLFVLVIIKTMGWKIAVKNIFTAVPICACGTVWYIYNLIVYKNPLFPFSVKIGSFTLFEGMNMSDVVMLENIPEELTGLGAFTRILYSWFYHDSLPVYSYDSRIGGLGVLFPILFACGVIALLLWFLKGNKKESDTFTAMMLISLFLMFVITPENWWARYTCFIVLFGIFGICILIKYFEKIKKALTVVVSISFLFNIFSSVGFDTYYYAKLFTDGDGNFVNTQRYSEEYTEELFNVIGTDKCKIISFRADCGGYEFYGKNLKNEYSWYTYENFYKTSGKDVNFIDDENEFCEIIESEKPDYILISEPFFVFHIDYYMSTHNDYELIYEMNGERIYTRF